MEAHTNRFSTLRKKNLIRRRPGTEPRGAAGKRGRGRSVAAPPAVAAPVGVSRRGLAVFGPPAEDLVGAVVTAAAGHARRGLVDLEPGAWRGGGRVG